MGLFSERTSPLLERMQAENALRYQFHLSQLSKDHRQVLQLLPMIFHLDGSLLFPSLEGDAVYGVYGYDPSDDDRSRLVDWFPTLKTLHPKKTGFFNRHQGIEFLYLMGSAGTLAFSAGSDMDFWIGIDRSKFKASELELLRQKISLLENWAMTSHKLEVHFFATDIEDLRNEEFGELGGESCGSALKKLLKDEFYRSMIWIAGKKPVHWARPLEGGKFQATKSLVEIGSVDDFAEQEIFGAALWQILKGLHSPFKSVIKIALLEAYAFSDPVVLLCNQLKRKIAEADEVERLDPYLEMMEAVRRFKRSQPGSDSELRLLETCFLVKCLAGVSTTQHAKKWNALQDLATSWMFGKDEFAHMHAFSEWPYAEKAALAKAIQDYFIATYLKLQPKASLVQGAISDRDRTIMGKTLRAYLKQEPGKVSRMFHLLDARTIHIIRFVKARNSQNTELWIVQVDFHTSSQTGKQVPVCEHTDLLHACAWLAVNGLYHDAQKFTVHMNHTHGVQFISEFLKQFAAFLPTESILEQVSHSWNGIGNLQRVFVVVNARSHDSCVAIETLDCFALNEFGEVHQHIFAGPQAFENLARTLILKSFDIRSLSEDSVVFFDYGQMAQAKSKLTKELEKSVEALLAKVQAHVDHTAKKNAEPQSKKTFWKLSALWADL